MEITTMKLAEPNWVVQGLIPVGLSVLAGKPKTGKSWLMLDLSLAVAAGGKVLGAYEAKRGDVLHLALEDKPNRLQSRLKRILDGKAAPDKGHFFLQWPRVEEHGLEALRRSLDQHPDTRFVVIDTLAKMRIRPTANGSIYHEDYDAIGLLKTIADEYAIGMVVVHHLRKATSDDPLDGVSGSTGLTGAVDTTLVLRRERLETDASLFVTGRDVEEQEIALSMDPRTMQWKALGRADDYRMGQERRQILDALAKLGRPMGPSEIAALINKKRPAVQRLMLAMTQQGQLQWIPGGKYELKKEGGHEKL
jgi:RecA-family ATPase